MIARFLCGLVFLGLMSFAPAEEPAATPSRPAYSAAPTEFDSFIVVLLVRPPEPAAVRDGRARSAPGKASREYSSFGGGGKIFKAGPFEDYSGRNVRGMFILKTDSLEEARAWVATDPLIKTGRLKAEYLKWYVEKGSLK